MTRHVIITGITSCENRGVEALAASIVAHLQEQGRSRFTVLTQTPSLDRAILSSWDVECTADPFVISKSWSAARPTETHEQAHTRGETLVAGADLVVATGGDLYTSDYGVSTPYLSAPSAAQRHGVPVAMLAHSIGPFTNASDAHRWIEVAGGCDVLTTRETVSQRYVVEQLGIPADKSRLAADPAFLLPAIPERRIEEILSSVGVEPDQPYVCVTPSQGIARFRRLDGDSHARALTSLVEHLVSTWRTPVLLLPHVHDSRPHNDDRILVARLEQDIAHPNVRHVRGSLTAADYKGVAGRAALVIAERLHAAIGALSSAVPTIVVGYSQKFLGVMADTYGEDIPIGSVHVDVETFVANKETGARLLDSVDLQAMRRALTARLPAIVDRARTNFTLLSSATTRTPM